VTGSPPRVWVLNLDAEHEFEQLASARTRGRQSVSRASSSERVAPYQARKGVRSILEREVPRAARALLAESDLLAGPDGLTDRHGAPVDVERARGAAGVAWSPTPTSLQRLSQLGVELPDSPSGDVLARVNARPFTAALCTESHLGGLPKRVLVRREDVLAHLAQPSRLGWLVRRPFGAAGRGRRRIHAGSPPADELAWIDAGLRSGPLGVEPFVQITRETTRCAWLSREGALTIAGSGFQTTTPTGGWVDTAPVEARAIDDTDDVRLLHALEVAGRALHADGYFGPYGIDAFWHRPLDGSPGEALNPLSEINARLTMDWNLPRAGV
jgi:hypothetical protein